MKPFTKEHEAVREKYRTKVQAEHLVDRMSREMINADTAHSLETLPYFFFATSSAQGDTNVNFKGLKSGKLIKVLDEKHLIFPDYKGNGIFHGLGDIQSNPKVALLCIDFTKDIRIKISGKARVIDDAQTLARYSDLLQTNDARRIIEVCVTYLIPNCSQQLSVVRENVIKDYWDSSHL